MASPRQVDDVPLLKTTEKLDAESHPSRTSVPERQPQNPRKMSRPRMVFVIVVGFLAALGMASAVMPGTAWSWRPCHQGQAIGHGFVPDADQASFLSSLEQASPEALHELLHKFFPQKYQHGVFPSEHQAVEALREADADTASAIVQLARRDNSTSLSEPPPPASTSSMPLVTGSSTTESLPPTPTTTATGTSSNTPPTSSTTSAASSTLTTPTDSVSSSSGTSKSQSVTTQSHSLSSSRTSGTSLSSSSSGRASSAGDSTFTTSTNAATSTSSSPHSSKLVTSTYTSTNQNGGVVVVTATTFVGADGGETYGASTTKQTGSLQTNAAPLATGCAAGLNLMVGIVVGGALLA